MKFNAFYLPQNAFFRAFCFSVARFQLHFRFYFTFHRVTLGAKDIKYYLTVVITADVKDIYRHVSCGQM